MAGPPPPYIPPPPPPPPNYAYGEGFMRKPTSGKAIASLVCGLVGMIGIFCYLPVVGSLVGAVLGILGIIETGREGSRSGRGLAIAGTICSVLAVAAFVAYIGFITFMMKLGEEQMRQEVTATLDADQRKIVERLKAYYVENDRSLGPGGPVQARARATTTEPRPANSGEPADSRQRVVGTLTIEHLVAEGEVGFSGGRGGGGLSGELTITGNSSATLSARGWDNELLREVVIRDIGRDDIVQTVP